MKSPLNIKTVSLAVCAFTLIAGGAALVISRGNKKADEVRLSDKFPASSQIKGMKTANNADLDAKLDSDFSKFLDGDRRKLDHLNLHEADKVRENKSATNENLRAALETYESYIAMRTASGAVSGPDELLSRALIGAYDVNLRLEQFQKLGKLEKQITLVCPDDSKPPKFPESRNMADKAYQLFQKGSECFVKENKPSDAVNSLESASLMWDKIHAKDGLKNVILELNIGTTCLYFSNWQKAKTWLERTWVDLQPMPNNRSLAIPTLIRLAVAYQNLKEYKAASQKFQAAEKLLLVNKLDDAASVHLWPLYFNWAVFLRDTGKFDEAEVKLKKAVTKDEKQTQALQNLKASIEKQRRMAKGSSAQATGNDGVHSGSKP